MRNAGFLVAAKAVSKALRLFYVVVLVRYLGPELFGLFTYLQSWHLVFFSLALFGTGRLISKQIGGDPENAEQYAATGVALRFLTASVATLGCMAVALHSSIVGESVAILCLFALAVFARAMAMWAQNLFVAFEVTHLGLRQEAIYRTLEVILGLSVLALGGGLLEIVGIYALSWLLQTLSSWRLVYPNLVEFRMEWRCRELMAFVRIALPFMLFSISLAALLKGSIVTYKLALPTAEEFGQVALVMQVLIVFAVLPKSLASAALPVFSRWVAEGVGKRTGHVTNMLQVSIVSAAALAMVTTLVAPQVFPRVFGAGYVPAASMVGPAMWLILPIGMAILLNQLTTAHGRHWEGALAAALGAVITLLTIFVTAPVRGSDGLFLGIAAGATVWSCVEAIRSIRLGWLPAFETFARPLLATAFAALLFGASVEAMPWVGVGIAGLILGLGIWPRLGFEPGNRT